MNIRKTLAGSHRPSRTLTLPSLLPESAPPLRPK